MKNWARALAKVKVNFVMVIWCLEVGEIALQRCRSFCVANCVDRCCVHYGQLRLGVV